MTINKQKLYTDYLSKLEQALLEDNFENLDYILEYMYQSWIPEDIIEPLENLLVEATLYTELKDQEYKNEALKMILEFK
jgi:hypothetical protein